MSLTNSPAQPMLTDEEIRAVWVEHGLDDEAVEDFARAIESALLSKLCASVADERAAFETFQRGAGLNELYLERHPESGQYMWTATKEAWETWQARAALASAAVAGEAQPVAEVVSRYGDPEAFGERDLKVLVDLNSYPYGAKFYAAPQASEAVRIPFPTHLRKMWSGGEVQAWLDEHQGVTTAKPSAKGSLQRYREWQANQDSGVADLRQACNTFGSKVFKALAAIARVDGPDTRKEDDPELIYREPVMDEAVRIRQAYDELSAALSAQPGAQKNGGSDA